MPRSVGKQFNGGHLVGVDDQVAWSIAVQFLESIFLLFSIGHTLFLMKNDLTLP